MPIDKQKSLQKYIESRVGAPAVSLCDNEKQLLACACEVASGEYWTATPYRTEYTILSQGGCSNATSVPISSLLDAGFGTNEIKNSAFFVGVLRYDFSNIYTRYLGSYNRFDSALLGGKVNQHSSPYEQRDPRYMADRIQRAVTEEDMIFGELEFHHDIVKQEIQLLIPDIQGSVQLYVGWGFDPDKTTEIVPANHFNVYRKLVAYHFLTSVLAARSAITLDADFQVSTEFIEKVRDEIKEEYTQGLADIAVFPAIWG